MADEWISHVQILERMNRPADSIVLDDEVSRKIESTIIRTARDDQNVKPLINKSDSITSTPPSNKLDIDSSEIIRSNESTSVQQDELESSAKAEDMDIRAFVETMIGEPVTAQAAAAVNSTISEAVVVDPQKLETKSAESYVEVQQEYGFPFYIDRFLLGIGVVIYVIALILYSMSYVDVPIGWALSIAGALTLTIGVSMAYERFTKKSSSFDKKIYNNAKVVEEVIICPRCHEEVEETDERCPSCGAAFSH
ncbi:MAG: hypothetical protein QW520_06695 [Methanomassiliicoccales archaeon]